MEFFLRQVLPWLKDIAAFSPLLPIVVGLFLLKRTKGLKFRLVFGFAVFIGLCEAASMLTVLLGTKNNLWISHLYTAVEFILLGAIFYYSFRGSVIKKSIIGAAGVLLVISLVNATVYGDITQMNSMTKMAANSMLIIFAVLYFYKVANDLTITYLDSDPVFVLSCAILIYKAGTSMSYAMFNDALAQSYDAARICLVAVVVLNILFNTTLAFVLRKASVC